VHRNLLRLIAPFRPLSARSGLQISAATREWMLRVGPITGWKGGPITLADDNIRSGGQAVGNKRIEAEKSLAERDGCPWSAGHGSSYGNAAQVEG
jgi:hypothetical protein